MRFRITLLVLIISLFAVAVTMAAGQEEDSPWLAVGDGIDYQEFQITTPDPIHVYVARMDRSNTNAILDSAVAQGRISYGTEKVSDTIQALRRHDQLLGRKLGQPQQSGGGDQWFLL